MILRTKFGLVGKNIGYSFSKKYFTNKFEQLKLQNLQYYNFDIPEIEEFPFILYQKKDEFRGLNVTIPYKKAVIKYLDELKGAAKEIGAVNTIKVTNDNLLIGYNTDVYGFEESLKPLLKQNHNKALILGTGGASKAVAWVLQKLGIEFKYVSRKLQENAFLYSVLNENIIKEYTLIINCSPVGTYPATAVSPNIPYQFIGKQHLLYDLIYNPIETQFLLEGKERGATIKNGLEMLELQAEKSWEIWNS